MWNIDFITREEFDAHVASTIRAYAENLVSFDTREFNRNRIDPIKLTFDKYVYELTWEQVVKSEIVRQRDKSNNNSIGYFHQKIFYYIRDCDVPIQGWDVIFSPENGVDVADDLHVSRVFAEVKNKHNTLNSSSKKTVHKKMEDQLLRDDDCACLLVEAVAKKSQNIIWSTTIDGRKTNHNRIRRVSMDRFYEMVTGDSDAFYKVCLALPDAIERVLADADEILEPHDTVYRELREQAVEHENSVATALYLLGFSGYQGFPM